MSATPEELAMVDAYIDKELDGPDAERVAKLIAERTELRSYADQQRRLKAQLDAAFSSVVSADPPTHLVDAVRRSPMPVATTKAQRASMPAPLRHALPIAAAVLLSLGLGLYLGQSTSRSIVGAGSDGIARAQGALASALTSQLAADDQGAIAVGLSFRSKDNGLCRTFVTTAHAGIACRDAIGWAITDLTRSEGQGNDPTKFQTAGAPLPQVLRDRVKAMIDGDVFDAAAERAARDRDWRSQ